MIRLCVLGSGSSGNCIYIGGGTSALLLDAGFPAREILKRLQMANLDIGAIKGIVISHEHSDHVRGVGPLSRRLKIPVFANRRTYARIKNTIGDVGEVMGFETGSGFSLDCITVESFSIPHDSADPCSFIFRHEERKVAVTTDAGAVTRLMREKLKNMDYVVVEANHDPEMLKAGPYPWKVKQRIASRSGHLSNEAGVQLVSNISHEGLQGVTFAHLSKTNNNPDLLRLMAGAALGVTPFEVATQDKPGNVMTVE